MHNLMRRDSFTELLHRVANEYAGAISAIRLAAARPPGAEAKSARDGVADRLTAYASAHCAMRPISASQPVDLVEHLTRLCSALALAGLSGREISLTLDVRHPLTVEASDCWRVGLVVGELINNASRHAFEAGCGSIIVAARRIGSHVVCTVSDDGVAPLVFAPGLGSRVVDALAAELGGRVDRKFGPRGTTVTLLFEQRASLPNDAPISLRWPHPASPPPLYRDPNNPPHDDVPYTEKWS